MAVKEIYEEKTGDKQPDNQIDFHGWYNRYVVWLEEQYNEVQASEKKEKTRYFVVFYTCEIMQVRAPKIFFTPSWDGTYLDILKTQNDLIIPGEDNIVRITNIIELSKSDYEHAVGDKRT